MDQIDRQLLNLLTKDGRVSNVTLAGTLGVARATVQNRISRLIKNNVIKRFTVELHEDYERRVLRAITTICIQPGKAGRIDSALKKIPNVTRVLSLSAPFDFLVETAVDNLKDLDDLVGMIRDIDGVIETNTSLILRE